MPAPPLFKQRQGPGNFDPPSAKQSHGNFLHWGQEASKLEDDGNRVPHRKRLVPGFEQRNLHTDVIHWSSDGPNHKRKSTSFHLLPHTF